jgi:hypothetical protein
MSLADLKTSLKTLKGDVGKSNNEKLTNTDKNNCAEKLDTAIDALPGEVHKAYTALTGLHAMFYQKDDGLRTRTAKLAWFLLLLWVKRDTMVEGGCAGPALEWDVSQPTARIALHLKKLDKNKKLTSSTEYGNLKTGANKKTAKETIETINARMVACQMPTGDDAAELADLFDMPTIK